MAIDFTSTFGARPPAPEDEICLKDDVSLAKFESYAALRTAAIFRPRTARDPMGIQDGRQAALVNKYFLGAPAVEPFRITPSKFLAHALANAPQEPDGTVSAFANWVYSLYGKPGSDDRDMEAGLEAEREINRQSERDLGARSIITACSDEQLLEAWPGWKLVHRGLHLDPDNPNIPYFQISDLKVGGRPLRASPDLVFRNNHTNEVIIVEVKLSRQPIPSNLWPNVWAQLWCYSNVPVARQASRVTVVAEIWGELNKWSRGARRTEQWVCLRSSVRRDPRARPYDRFFRRLFDIYRGVQP